MGAPYPLSRQVRLLGERKWWLPCSPAAASAAQPARGRTRLYRVSRDLAELRATVAELPLRQAAGTAVEYSSAGFMVRTWAEGLLGFTSTGAIVTWVPLFLFVILFACRWTTTSLW